MASNKRLSLSGSQRASVSLTAIRRSIFAILVVMGLVGGDASAAKNPFGTLDTAAIDRFVTAEMAAHRIPGMALAITHADTIVYVQGYGAASDGEPVTGQTSFRLASLSKSFTAVAVLQLVESDQVDLDMPITYYLPDFTLATAAAADQITVRQLLNHTSGLADIGFANGLAHQQTTLADRIKSLHAARPVDPPGAAFHYFDPNYQILARLVEVVSEQPFDEYLQQHIFAQLDMRATISTLTSDAATQRAPNLAQGHIVVYGFPQAVPELSGFVGGSGGVVSTAQDMAHYLLAQSNNGQYADHRILSPHDIDVMHTPPRGSASRYGMGWFVGEAQGVRTIEHNGILSTSYAEAVLLPDRGYGFVLLYNEYGLAASALAFPSIKNGMVALLTNQEPSQPRLTVPRLTLIFAA